MVIIEWVDASRLANGWIDVSDIPNAYLHRCVTVGFVISANRESKILVPTIADIEHTDNSHAYGGMLIPARAILSVRTLKV